MDIFKQCAIGIVFALGLFSCANSVSEQPTFDGDQSLDSQKAKIERMEKLYQEYGWSFTPKKGYTREECFLLMDYDSVKLSLSQAMQRIASFSSEARSTAYSIEPRAGDIFLENCDLRYLPHLRYEEYYSYLGRSPKYAAYVTLDRARCDFSISYENIRRTSPGGGYRSPIVGNIVVEDVRFSDDGLPRLDVKTTEVVRMKDYRCSILLTGYLVMDGLWGENTIPGYAHIIVGLGSFRSLKAYVVISGKFMRISLRKPGSRIFHPQRASF